MPPIHAWLASKASRDSGRHAPCHCNLHGDAVPTLGCGKVWAKLLQSYSWSCLLARGTTKERSLYLWGVFEQNLKPGADGTLHHFFQVLKWSFTALQTGRFPSHDWKGRRYTPGSQEHALSGKFLAAGFCGHLVSIQGDLDWHASALDLPQVESQSRRLQCLQRFQMEVSKTWKVFNNPDYILNLEWAGSRVAHLGKEIQMPTVHNPFCQCLQCDAGLPSPETAWQ